MEIVVPTTRKKAATPQPDDDETTAIVTIDKIEACTIRVPIIGRTPLIVNRFSEKAKRLMLDSFQGRKTPRQPKDPQAEYEAAFYLTEKDEYGFPVTAFKKATVGGARFYGSQVTMTGLRASVFMRGILGSDGMPLTVIEGKPWMREDVVRNNRNSTDLRYRPQFDEWSTTIEVTYVKSMLVRSSVLSLIDAGGLGVGVGEWRPEKGGDFGTYAIDPERAVEVLS